MRDELPAASHWNVWFGNGIRLETPENLTPELWYMLHRYVEEVIRPDPAAPAGAGDV